MNLFYSVGGGLGHLTRFSCFCKTLPVAPPITVVASSPFVKDHRVVAPSNDTIIPPFYAARDQASLTKWFQELVDRLQPDKVFIDAFPGGILGELNQVFFPKTCECFMLARIIKWESYRPRIDNFRLKFDKTFVLEPIIPDYRSFLAQYSDTVEDFQLLMPDIEASPVEISDNTWLVIHSGPDSELQQLLKAAEEDAASEHDHPQILVIYPGKRPDIVHAGLRYENLYPAYGLFPRAGRVYSAAGFNIIHQMRDFRYKHFVMPFSRLFDDQFARIDANRNEFARILTP